MWREPAFAFSRFSLINPTVTSNSSCWNKTYLSPQNAQSQAGYLDPGSCSLMGETLK